MIFSIYYTLPKIVEILEKYEIIINLESMTQFESAILFLVFNFVYWYFLIQIIKIIRILLNKVLDFVF